MVFMRCMIKYLLAILMISSCTTHEPLEVIGKWHCVFVDSRGFQKLNSHQRDSLKSSILNITENQIFYEGIEFVDTCRFNSLDIIPYIPDSFYNGLSVQFRYSYEERREMSKIITLNSNGEESTCYNNCSTFLLKEDTLINFCGGYTFYLLKNKQ